MTYRISVHLVSGRTEVYEGVIGWNATDQLLRIKTGGGAEVCIPMRIIERFDSVEVKELEARVQ